MTALGVWIVCLESSNHFCHLEIKGLKTTKLEEPKVAVIGAGRRGDSRNASVMLSQRPHSGKPCVLQAATKRGSNLTGNLHFAPDKF